MKESLLVLVPEPDPCWSCRLGTRGPASLISKLGGWRSEGLPGTGVLRWTPQAARAYQPQPNAPLLL